MKSFLNSNSKVRLMELRRQHGLSQLKPAVDLDMNQNSISRCEIHSYCLLP